MDKTTKDKIVGQIMNLDAWADTEELTFPNYPSESEQNEWFDTFIMRLEQRIRGVLDDEYPESDDSVYSLELHDLPLGTRFYVSNGAWYGRIAGTPDSKQVFVEATGKAFPLTLDYGDLSFYVVDEDGVGK